MQQLLKTRQQLTAASGVPVRIEKYLGGGGQGEVYRGEYGGRPAAVKWYFPRSATREQRRILEELVRRPAPSERFLWPLEIVSDAQVAGFGYVMNLREPRFCGIVDLMKRRVTPSFRALLRAGTQLADSYHQLHSAGLCYRDISFGNVFFDQTSGDVQICDNDNVTFDRAEGSPTGVLGTPKFMAPEVVRRDALPSSATDRYSLAVLLFYMLCVSHPLEGLRETQIHCLDLPAQNKLYGEEPLFIFDPADDRNRPDPTYHRNALEFWPLLPPELRTLFVQSFTDGIRSPQHGRVRETQWLQAFESAMDAIAICSCGEENFFDGVAMSEDPTCWACKQPVRWPPRLRLSNKRLVMLNHNTRLLPRHLALESTNSGEQTVAEVAQHPQDRQIWGLKNCTDAPWTAKLPDGAVCDVPPGKSVRLAAQTTVNFGRISGELET